MHYAPHGSKSRKFNLQPQQLSIGRENFGRQAIQLILVSCITLCLLLWLGFWKTMKLLLSVRGDFSVRWRELRLGLSRIESANFQWWQFGSPREPTRENTDRLTVGGRVSVGRYLLIHEGWFTQHDSSFGGKPISRTLNFRFPWKFEKLGLHCCYGVSLSHATYL